MKRVDDAGQEWQEAEVKTVGDLVKYVWSRMDEPGPVP